MLLSALVAVVLGTTAFGETREISNGSLRIAFDASDGRLVSLQDVRSGVEFIDPAAVSGPCWNLRRADGSQLGEGSSLLDIREAGDLSMVMDWEMASGARVEAKVRLDPEKPLSYWTVAVSGIKDLEAFDLRYPVIQGIRELENEDLAVSSWLGSVIHNPHAPVTEASPVRWLGWDSPGILSMQMLALYDREGRDGLYMASNDTCSNAKRFDFMLTPGHTMYFLTHYLPYKSGEDSFAPEYEAVLGSLNGDWLTAAKTYREWAVDQRWCRESRFHNGRIPKWVTRTGLWVWNRGWSDNVLTEARHMKRRLGLPVSVFWHWWHGCSYDEGFPEYLPPREGGERFRKAVAAARRDKVNSIVYMNSFQWGTSTESWVSEHAQDYCAKPLGGTSYAATANIFTGRQIAAMCLGTEFWREKYSSIADSAIRDYGVSGIYMDQACSSIKCYDPSHGHTLGGGSYWTDGFAKQAALIREKTADVRRDVVLAGEGSGEDWIPSLDLFLTLEASRERYLGTGDTEVLPLYQAVYHDYAVTFGSYSSLVYPPYDDLWPDEFRPANRETSLPDDFNLQFRMEQARSFVYGMQLTLANYHSFLDEEKKDEIDYLMRLARVRSRAVKYLLGGTFERVPEMEVPRDTILLSKVSIYAGRSGSTVKQEKMEEPMLYSGMWKAADGDMALALVNISDASVPVSFSFAASEYGLPDSVKVTLISENGRRRLCRVRDGRISVDLPLSARTACVIEFAAR